MAITSFAIDGGHVAGQPLELELGIDLADPSTIEQVMDAFRTLKPWIVIIGFPCSPWSALMNLTIAAGFGARVAARRHEHYVFLELTRDVLRLQCSEGRLAIAENPIAIML